MNFMKNTMVEKECVTLMLTEHYIKGRLSRKNKKRP